MKTTHLDEFIEYAKNKVTYIPIGTIEWHGEYLPIETDFMIAQKICEMLSEKFSGYILPPIYFGTDKSEGQDSEKIVGMERHLHKKLQGSLYYLEPKLLEKLLSSFVKNLINQGFEKIIIITGHAGSAHIKVLEKINQQFKEVIFTNPYAKIDYEDEGGVGHAGEMETSLFWTLYPEEEEKSRSRQINKDSDICNFVGYNILNKSSVEFGRNILEQILMHLQKEIGISKND